METEWRLNLVVTYETEANRDAAATALKATVLSGVVSKAAGAGRAEIIKDSYVINDPIVSGRESLAVV